LLHHVHHLNEQYASLCRSIKQQYQIEPSTDVLVLQNQLSNLRDFFSVLKAKEIPESRSGNGLFSILPQEMIQLIMMQLNNPRDLLCALGATNKQFNALVSEASQIWSALLRAQYPTRDTTHHLLTAHNTPRYVYIWLHYSPTALPLESQSLREFGTFSWFEQQHAVIYQGERKNGKPHGWGKFTFPNGSTYTGQWCEGERNGFGVRVWSDGGKYEGEWRKNKREGHGTHSRANGTCYTGEWKKNRRDGWGVFQWSDGDKYYGHWHQSRRLGLGVLYQPSDQPSDHTSDSESGTYQLQSWIINMNNNNSNNEHKFNVHNKGTPLLPALTPHNFNAQLFIEHRGDMSVFDHPLSLLALSAVKTRSSQDVSADDDSYSSDSSATDIPMYDTCQPVERTVTSDRHVTAVNKPSLYMQTLQFNFHRSLLATQHVPLNDTHVSVTGVKRSISELESDSSAMTDEELELSDVSRDHVRKRHKSVDK
jgi:hypothetical protein